MDLQPYRDFIVELAAASGDYIRPFFGNPTLAIELKGDDTPVTAADRGAELLLRKKIAQRFPSHGILGEEFPAERVDAEFVWVLDPIDGTKSFASACPLFGTLIALTHRGKPILGCIHQPILNQLVIGDGSVTTLNGERVHMRRVPSIAQATLLTSDPLAPAAHQSASGWETLTKKTRLVRTWGDCYGYLLVASGWADIMADPIMNPWDIAALIPVVRGAGGVITDWQGGDPIDANSIVAAAPELHGEVIRILNP